MSRWQNLHRMLICCTLSQCLPQSLLEGRKQFGNQMRGPCAWCWWVLEDPDAVGTCQLLENDLEQSCIVHVVVHVYLEYGVHGQAKFTAIIGFGGRLDVGQQHEHELWDANDDTICSHLHHIQLHQLHVDADLLAKVEVVVDSLKQLL